ncbi:beta strand repeat-containing protein [Haloferula rosea]|uniref:Uncharacterized protein n=1 Tax=Haloferula rosea TaxID=490093 RepID=A0A934VFD8_9BACT|nr:hypothetical protein [Haloferula rosea]MBK1826892.1 hypothetical protein [Haloferula rosea]
MRTLPTLPLAVVALLPALAPAAIINATFSAGVDSDWSTPGNWTPVGVPTNNATDQFNVSIPTGQLASLNTNPTINQLNVGTGAALNWISGRFLTCSGDITNSGLLQLIGTSTNTRLTVNDPSDHLVNLTGSGTLRLTATTQSITGVAPTVLSIGSNQRIEGFGTLSSNSIDLVNSGTLAGDSAIAPLVITPKDTLQNFGTIVAESNGKLTLSSGLFTGPGAYRIDDFGALTLSSVTLEGITLSVTNTDGDLFNNVATVAGSTTLKEFINEAKLSSNFGVLLELGGDITNNGIIEINGATTNSRISINDTVDQNVTINGTGSILLTEAQHRIQGSSGSTLTLGSGQTLRGLGNLGTNLVNFVNQGTVVADQAAGSLVLDPALTFINNGSLRAESGGIAQFNGGTYSGAGAFIISDNSEFRISSGTFENLTFTSDDLDATPGNNLISLTGSAIFDGITNNATIDITFGRTLTLVDDFINNSTVTLNGATTNSRISITDNDDQAVLLDGAGSIKLTDLAQNITGSSSHLLTIGASQTIHGTGKVGNNQLNLINQGTITADVPGASLVIDPATTFDNFGTVEAIGGGDLLFNPGTYTGTGAFLIRDASSFSLAGGTYTQITFSADDQDAIAGNNELILSGSSTFNQVITDAAITKRSGRVMTLTGDLTNNGTLTFEGISTNDRISITDNDDQAVLIDGAGSIELTDINQNITGTNSHQLTLGANQTIHGTGKVGNNQLNLVNQGTITADVPGTSLVIDPSTTFENFGTIGADPGCTLILNAGTYTGAGVFRIPDTAGFTLVGGGIYDGITFSNDGNPDDDLTNNDINLTGTVTFRNVTNQATVNLANATSITLADDNTNHGLIELNGTSTLTRITVNDPVDQSVLLDGSGTLRLTADEQNITGSFGHLLTNGALHTMEGYGRVGTNIINLVNQGTIHANVSGETIAIDPSTSFSNTGTLTTDAGATLTFIGTGHVNETTGTITGNGTVTTTSAASFTNHGTIAPGNSVGSLTIEDMTHSASSQWQFEIEGTAGPGTGHDSLHVEGDLALTGLLIPQLVGPFIPAPSDTFVIITATGDITGDFTAISQPAGIGTWTATVDEVNDQVILSFVEDTTLDFAEYQALYFTPTQIANGDADPDADFDGDGLTTFVEWIFGFDPTSPVIPVPTLTVARTGSFIDLTYPESALLPENAYVVEVETDLDLQNPWTLISGSDYTRHAEIPSPGNPNIDQVTLRTNTPIWSTDPKRFFRLRFSEPVE